MVDLQACWWSVSASHCIRLHEGNGFILFSITSDNIHKKDKKNIIKVNDAGSQQLGCVKLTSLRGT